MDITALLFFCFCIIKSIDAASDQRIISVEHGHDVTLSCEAPGRGNIIVVEWIRPDLEDGYVAMYKDKKLYPEAQHQSYRDRVDLQVKNRTISLVLKNVTSDDEGTYESRVFKRNSPRHQRSVLGGDPVCSISLRVGPPDPPPRPSVRRSMDHGLCSLLCYVDEAPPLTSVVWMKGQEVLNRSSSSSVMVTILDQDLNSSLTCSSQSPAENSTVEVEVVTWCGDDNRHRPMLIFIFIPVFVVIVFVITGKPFKQRRKNTHTHTHKAQTIVDPLM